MIYLDLPNINTAGTVEEQISQICSYIYKNNEQMNATLANLTTEKIWENTATALSSAESQNEAPQLLSKYAKIRDLIIKTATEVQKTDEHYSMLMSGSYLAKSQFGEYLLNTSVEVDGSSTGFTELYQYSTELGSDYAELNEVKLDYDNYIKRGLLDNSGATPIYGIELGLLGNTITVNGQEISTGEKYKTRITPNKWSFLRGSTEVASITEDAITFPKAHITGGSININNKFLVDSEGNMTAKSGTFSGNLSSTSVISSLYPGSSMRMDIDYNVISFVESSEKTLSLYPNGLIFYNRVNSVDKEICRIARSTSANNIGVLIELIDNYGSFFAIGDSSHTDITYVPRNHPSTYAAVNGLHIGADVYFSGNVNISRGANGSFSANGHSLIITNGIITNIT